MIKKFGLPLLLVGVVLSFIILSSVAFFFGAPILGKGTDVYTKKIKNIAIVKKIEISRIVHLETPNSVRAIYMSQCAASSKNFRDKIVSLVEETEINSIILDVKDYSGTVSFPRGEGVESLGGEGCIVSDMKEFLEELHRKGIYLIARITVFQDPLYTKTYPELAVQSKSKDIPWEDYNGLEFVDVGAEPFWDYIIDIAIEARDIGFDELNFDYIRFPSDGPMDDAVYNYSDYNQRAVELEKFFRYLTQKLRKPDVYGFVPKLSADLFGMTTTNKDDLTIGQVQERTTPYFDFVAPMTYPSHYPSGFIGYKNPNNNVYGVIRYSLDESAKRLVSTTTQIASLSYKRIGTTTPAMYSKPSRDLNIMRPWLQDFNYGGVYGPEKIKAQIQAVYDSGMNSWMLWDPGNTYTKEALEPN